MGAQGKLFLVLAFKLVVYTLCMQTELLRKRPWVCWWLAEMAILGQLRHRMGTPQPPPAAARARAASKNTPQNELMTRGTRHARRMQKLRGCSRENSIF